MNLMQGLKPVKKLKPIASMGSASPSPVPQTQPVNIPQASPLGQPVGTVPQYTGSSAQQGAQSNTVGGMLIPQWNGTAPTNRDARLSGVQPWDTGYANLNIPGDYFKIPYYTPWYQSTPDQNVESQRIAEQYAGMYGEGSSGYMPEVTTTWKPPQTVNEWLNNYNQQNSWWMNPGAGPQSGYAANNKGVRKLGEKMQKYGAAIQGQPVQDDQGNYWLREFLLKPEDDFLGSLGAGFGFGGVFGPVAPMGVGNLIGGGMSGAAGTGP